MTALATTEGVDTLDTLVTPAVLNQTLVDIRAAVQARAGKAVGARTTSAASTRIDAERLWVATAVMSLALVNVHTTLLAISLVAVRAGATVETSLRVGALGQWVTQAVMVGALVHVGATDHTITGITLGALTTCEGSLLINAFGERGTRRLGGPAFVFIHARLCAVTQPAGGTLATIARSVLVGAASFRVATSIVEIAFVNIFTTLFARAAEPFRTGTAGECPWGVFTSGPTVARGAHFALVDILATVITVTSVSGGTGSTDGPVVFLDALGEGVTPTIVLGAQLVLSGENVYGLAPPGLTVESSLEPGGPPRVHVLGTVPSITTSSGVETHTNGAVIFVGIGDVDAVGPTTTTGLSAVPSTRCVAVGGLAVFTVFSTKEAVTPPLKGIVGHAPVSGPPSAVTSLEPPSVMIGKITST